MNEHSIELRVRYEETDQMGVVYYANYLVWYEIARTEFFRSRGFEYRKLEEEDRIFIPVVEAYCKYRAPLKYDDLITVTAELVDIGHTRLAFSYTVAIDGREVATGSTKHAFIDDSGFPIPVPEKIKEALTPG